MHRQTDKLARLVLATLGDRRLVRVRATNGEPYWCIEKRVNGRWRSYGGYYGSERSAKMSRHWPQAGS